MSTPNSILSGSKITPFFFATMAWRWRSGWLIWPEGMSYTAWQNLLKSYLWFLGKHNRVHVSRSGKYKKFSQDKEEQESEEIQQEKKASNVELESTEMESHDGLKLELITLLKQFCNRKHIAQHIEETIPDYRNQDLITYSKQSIIMSALAIFLFRMGSGNRFDTQGHDDDEKYSQANIAKFIESPENRVPVIKTIEKFLRNLKEDSVNDLMVAFFKDLQQSKFFKQHPEIMAGDFFLLAVDCVHTHTYDHPHHVDVDGNNDCEYCLKRVYSKRTKDEEVRWFHNTLVFSFVFMGGLKIPVYHYPIHAKQVAGFENASDDSLKQECEAEALKVALPVIREKFPRMKIALLLDGLYANRPIIRLAHECKCHYIIVRKEACLPSLAKDCDEKAALPAHKKNCTKRCKKVEKGCSIEQEYVWFNSRYLGDGLSTNVLRFWETQTREDGTVRSYKCEWLFSWRLSARTCELASCQARARWEVEDLFNTCKNRGYNLKHDYSRHPNSCFNWQGLALLAFGVFELFRFSQAVQQRCDLPQIILAQKLLGQLLHKNTEEILSEQLLSIRVQFRYQFAVNLNIILAKTYQGNDVETFNTS